MAFADQRGARFLLVLVAAATAVLVWFGNGLMPWWPLIWFAPFPALWYSLQTSWRRAGCAAFFGWLLGSTNMLGYLHAQGTPFLGWLADFGGLSLLFTLGVLLFRRLVRSGAIWSGVAALPAVWVSVDWLRYWATPHGTSADLAYTQLPNVPFLQTASLTGPWGMTFVLLWVPAAVAAFLFLRQKRPQEAWGLLTVTCVTIAFLFGFGAVRLMRANDKPTLKVGLVASDTPDNENVADPGQNARRLLYEYAERARTLITRGVKIVVLPEKIAVVRDQDLGSADASLQTLADATQAIIVAGELLVSSIGNRLQRYNRAQVYQPHSARISYDKEHMLPPFESNLVRGNQLLTLQQANNREGVAICKDMDFTSIGRQYGQLGTGMMLVPAWDFKLDRVWHGHMAIMRGVESGFSIVRAAKDGSLLVSDAYGRVIAERLSGSAPFATLVAEVPVNHHKTLFQAWGNWFAWVAVALCGFVFAQAIRSRFVITRTNAKISEVNFGVHA